MTTPVQQMRSSIKAGITSFTSKYGEHVLWCPSCNKLGGLVGNNLVCENEECRVERFYSQ